MRRIKHSTAFRSDYRRVGSTPRYREIEALLNAVVGQLIKDEPLPESYRDHALSGNWRGYRECHVRPDLLLIYKKTDDGQLRLARLGSHSDLFG